MLVIIQPVIYLSVLYFSVLYFNSCFWQLILLRPGDVQGISENKVFFLWQESLF